MNFEDWKQVPEGAKIEYIYGMLKEYNHGYFVRVFEPTETIIVSKIPKDDEFSGIKMDSYGVSFNIKPRNVKLFNEKNYNKNCNTCRWYYDGLKCKSRCRICKDFNLYIKKKGLIKEDKIKVNETEKKELELTQEDISLIYEDISLIYEDIFVDDECFINAFLEKESENK